MKINTDCARNTSIPKHESKTRIRMWISFLLNDDADIQKNRSEKKERKKKGLEKLKEESS